MQNWFDLSDEIGKGLAIVNSCKYSGAAFENNLSLLVLRSPVYSHHVPTELELREDRYDFIDQGEQFFEYSIVPHGKAITNSLLVKKGIEVNQKPIAMFETYHEGTIKSHQGFLSINAENVIFSSLKQATVGDGYIIKLYEVDGKECVCGISFMEGKQIDIPMKPYEIKLVRIDKTGNLLGFSDFLEWEKD